jgi:uncharacterized lipoprotein
MAKISAFVLVVLLATSLGGCKVFRGTCVRAEDYSGAQQMPPLKVPAGLESPDTRAALKIPELSEPEKPRAPQECLDSPPKFSAPPASA